MKRFFGWGVFNTMRIAFRNYFRPVITLQYPKEKWELPERSRWAVAQKRDAEGNHKCTGCLACQKACPDYIIDIQLSQTENGKHIDHWRYELGACMMCGLCVEACPFDAIEMSHEYELARTDVNALTIDLLTDVDVAKPKRAERPAATRPAASPKDPAAEKRAEETPSDATAPVNEPAAQGEPESLDRSPEPTHTPAEPVEAPSSVEGETDAAATAAKPESAIGEGAGDSGADESQREAPGE